MKAKTLEKALIDGKTYIIFKSPTGLKRLGRVTKIQQQTPTSCIISVLTPELGVNEDAFVRFSRLEHISNTDIISVLDVNM